MARVRYLYHRDYDFGRGIPFVKKVHGFVLNKPAQIRDRLLQIGAASDDDFEAPLPLQESELSEVHTASLLRSRSRLVKFRLCRSLFLKNTGTYRAPFGCEP